jgi:hypothetical protein
MNDEVSKLGHHDDDPDDEVIEGRIVPSHQGPHDWKPLMDEFDRQVREQARRMSFVDDLRNIRDNLPRPSAHYIVDIDSIHVAQEPEGPWESTGFSNAGITFERSPDFQEQFESLKNWRGQTIEVEFEDVSTELFEMLSGYPKQVAYTAAAHISDMPEIPPVDPDRVKWPGR